jgi:hypothetical protein
MYNICENYKEFEYDYEKENPNALVKGYNISGTVYSLNPGDNPGAGWIL